MFLYLAINVRLIKRHVQLKIMYNKASDFLNIISRYMITFKILI